MFKKFLSILLAILVGFGPELASAQQFMVSQLPVPGTPVGVSFAFDPVLVKGLVIFPKDPLKFRFIVDSGNDKADDARIKEEGERMVKYFLAAVTVPEQDQWVNLSPLEHDRMIADSLGATDLGRDMLAQDYVLKQFTASMLNPDSGTGKEFWARVYAQAQEKFGTTDIPVDAFNKVWIMPDKAEVFERGNAVYVTKAHLKVLLDSDYRANVGAVQEPPRGEVLEPPLRDVMRSVILPAIETEVNTGANFATVRQIYYAGILARWYRDAIKNTLMASAYMDKSKTKGVDLDDKTLKEQIYQRYIEAYKKGVVNFIREERSVATGDIVPHKYFSGGMPKVMPDAAEISKTFDAAGVAGVGVISQVDFAMNPQRPLLKDGRRRMGDGLDWARDLSTVVSNGVGRVSFRIGTLADGVREWPLGTKITVPVIAAALVVGSVFFYQYQQKLGEQWVSSKSSVNMQQVVELSRLSGGSGSVHQLITTVQDRRQRMVDRIRTARAKNVKVVDSVTKDPLSDASRYVTYDGLVIAFGALTENRLSENPAHRIGGSLPKYWGAEVLSLEGQARKVGNEGKLAVLLDRLSLEINGQKANAAVIVKALDGFKGVIPIWPGEKKDQMVGHWETVRKGFLEFQGDEQSPEESLFARANAEMRGRTDGRLYKEDQGYKGRRDHRDVLAPFHGQLVQPAVVLARNIEGHIQSMISDQDAERLNLGFAAANTHVPVSKSETTYDSKGNSHTRYWTEYEDQSGIYRVIAAAYASSASSHESSANNGMRQLKQQVGVVLASPMFKSERLSPFLSRLKTVEVKASGWGTGADLFFSPVLNLFTHLGGNGRDALSKFIPLRVELEGVEQVVGQRLQEERAWVEVQITTRIDGEKRGVGAATSGAPGIFLLKGPGDFAQGVSDVAINVEEFDHGVRIAVGAKKIQFKVGAQEREAEYPQSYGTYRGMQALADAGWLVRFDYGVVYISNDAVVTQEKIQGYGRYLNEQMLEGAGWLVNFEHGVVFVGKDGAVKKDRVEGWYGRYQGTQSFKGSGWLVRYEAGVVVVTMTGVVYMAPTLEAIVSQYPQAAVFVTEKRVSSLQALLRPADLHQLLLQASSTRTEPLVIRHLMPKTLAPYGQKLNDGFAGINGQLPNGTQSFVREKGEDARVFLSRSSGKAAVILLEVHGSENAGDEQEMMRLVADQKQEGERLVVLIHRPEEMILRLAHQNKISVTEAKVRLGELLQKADAVVLLLESPISDLGYDQILPGKVIAIPHGAFAAQPVPETLERFTADAVAVLGSNTTWGEMRDMEDVRAIFDSVSPRAKNVLGYIAGSFDKRVDLGRYRQDPGYLFLNDQAILDARGEFDNEMVFRAWLHRMADGRIIVRVENDNTPSGLKGKDDRIFLWEQRLVDFNVQMYHENADLRYLKKPGEEDAPKFEASGTLHQGKAEIFIVSRSDSMQKDVSRNEGYRMLFVPYVKGEYQFDVAADDVVRLIQKPDQRLRMLQKNFKTSSHLGMKEIAYAHYQVMDFLLGKSGPVDAAMANFVLEESSVRVDPFADPETTVVSYRVRLLEEGIVSPAFHLTIEKKFEKGQHVGWLILSEDRNVAEYVPLGVKKTIPFLYGYKPELLVTTFPLSEGRPFSFYKVSGKVAFTQIQEVKKDGTTLWRPGYLLSLAAQRWFNKEHQVKAPVAAGGESLDVVLAMAPAGGVTSIERFMARRTRTYKDVSAVMISLTQEDLASKEALMSALDRQLAGYSWERDQLNSALPETKKAVDNAAQVGGIDIKNIDVARTGEGASIRFDEAALQEMVNKGFDGLTPVFLGITHLKDPLMGL